MTNLIFRPILIYEIQMEKFTFIRLWDIYRGLLTSTQQEICDLYFNFDLTLSEIAEEKGISRQAVSECLKTCKQQLEEYEDKLHFAEITDEAFLQFSFKLTDACRWAENFKAAHGEFSDDIEKLLKILNKDFSGEVGAAVNNPEAMKILRKDYTAEVYGRKKTGED